MSQSEVARKAGVSQPFLHDLENNRRGARPETMDRIADAMGVKVSILVEQEAG
jgi:transcriptional regulator with XRE-family HTH domain